MLDAIAAIRGGHSLYLQSVSEPDYNEVQVVLLEGRLGRGATPEEIEENPMLAKAGLVEHGPGCQIFVLSWPIYVAYAVENESYANSGLHAVAVLRPPVACHVGLRESPRMGLHNTRIWVF